MIERRPITDRAEWLRWRREDITASTIGALFGVHPYTTALRLYVERRGVEFPEVEDNKVLRRGRWLEPAVAKAVHELHPEWILAVPGEYLRDPALRLGATPDYYIHGDPRGRGILQAKTVEPGIFARDWAGGSEPPFWITLQATTEAMLAEAAFGAIAALIVDAYQMDCVVLEVPRNEAAEEKIRTAVAQFWQDVADGREPPPDYGKDADVIKALRPREQPGKSVDFTGHNELPDLLARRALLKEAIKTGTDECDKIDNQLRYMMGDAEFATGLNGWRITLKTETRNYPAREAHQTSSRVLRIQDKRTA